MTRVRKSYPIKVCSIVNSNKVAKLASKLKCTKSCIQLDVWSRVLLRIKRKKVAFVISTSPTSLLRLLELAGAALISPDVVIACPVGLVNCEISKRKLWLNQLGLPFLLIRGKMGGVAFGAAALNSLM
ncbi:MAG: precorrin-8X methylmutase [Candidatus Hodgkinia cicadicola]